MSTTAQSRNRRGEGERLRGALLSAATDMLSETPDVERLSVRALTARAGVTHTAMYLHFADKEALVQAVKARCFEDLADTIACAVRDASADLVDRLCSAGEAYLRFAAVRPGHYAIMFHSTRPQLVDAPEHVREAGVRAFGQLVVLTSAVVGESDSHAAATHFWLALHGRVSIQLSMPWFSMSDDATYVREQVDSLVRRQSR